MSHPSGAPLGWDILEDDHVVATVGGEDLLLHRVNRHVDGEEVGLLLLAQHGDAVRPLELEDGVVLGQAVLLVETGFAVGGLEVDAALDEVLHVLDHLEHLGRIEGDGFVVFGDGARALGAQPVQVAAPLGGEGDDARLDELLGGGLEVVPGPALLGSGDAGLLEQARVVDDGLVVGVARDADQLAGPATRVHKGREDVGALLGPLLVALEFGVDVDDHAGDVELGGEVVGDVVEVGRRPGGGERFQLVVGDAGRGVGDVDVDLLGVGLGELVEQRDAREPLRARGGVAVVVHEVDRDRTAGLGRGLLAGGAARCQRKCAEPGGAAADDRGPRDLCGYGCHVLFLSLLALRRAAYCCPDQPATHSRRLFATLATGGVHPARRIDVDRDPFRGVPFALAHPVLGGALPVAVGLVPLGELGGAQWLDARLGLLEVVHLDAEVVEAGVAAAVAVDLVFEQGDVDVAVADDDGLVLRVAADLGEAEALNEEVGRRAGVVGGDADVPDRRLRRWCHCLLPTWNVDRSVLSRQGHARAAAEVRFDEAELDLHRLHRNVDVAFGALAGFELPDDVADGADGRALALGREGLLAGGALGYRPASRFTGAPGAEELAVVPGGGAPLGADDVDVEPAVGNEAGFHPASIP